jgi:hypothetical protein
MTQLETLPQAPMAVGQASDELVKNGLFREGLNFIDAEDGYPQVVAWRNNVQLAGWDYGGNGEFNGQPGGAKSEYIHGYLHKYAFALSPERDKVGGSNAIDLIGGDNRHGFIGQLLSGLKVNARYDVSFWVGSHFYHDNGRHRTGLRYRVSDKKPDGDILDEEHISVPPPLDDTPPGTGKIPGGSWVRRWELHTKSFVARSTEAYISFADTTANGYYCTAQLASVSVRIAVSGRFTVTPGGPPDVHLSPGGAIGYPGVRLHAVDSDPVTRQRVSVHVPSNRQLSFVDEGTGFRLKVNDDAHSYLGRLSPDGQTLTFEDVDLALTEQQPTAVAWVAVKATPAAEPGPTYLFFHVGDETSHSTPIDVS